MTRTAEDEALAAKRAALIVTKFQWLAQVAATPGLGGLSARAAIVLVNHINGQIALADGVLLAYPNQETLAKILGATRDGVAKAIRALESAGHLTVRPGRGRTIHNVYELKTHTPVGVSIGGDAAENADAGMGFNGHKTPTAVGKTHTPVGKTHTGVCTIPLKETLEETFEGDIGTRPRKKPSRPLPDGVPSASDLSWAAERVASAGLGLDPAAEAEKFQLHHLSKGTLAVDWSASWRTWIVKAIGWAKERRAPLAAGQSGVAWALAGEDR